MGVWPEINNSDHNPLSVTWYYFHGSVWLQASPCLNNYHSSLPKSYLSPSTQCCSRPLFGGPACVNVTDWASAGSLIASFHGCESVPWSRSVNKLWMQAQRKQEEGEWLRWMEEQQARSAKGKKITAVLKWIWDSGSVKWTLSWDPSRWSARLVLICEKRRVQSSRREIRVFGKCVLIRTWSGRRSVRLQLSQSCISVVLHGKHMRSENTARSQARDGTRYVHKKNM